MIGQAGKIYKQIKKLTKNQKKILFLVLLALGFLFSLICFVYAPQAKKFRAIKKELEDSEAQISSILSIAKGRDLAVAITELKARFIEISSRLPAQDEDVVYNLSETAKKLNLELKSIIPSGKSLLEGRVPGYKVEELPISLNLFGEFRAFGEYLNRLRNNFPSLISVRGLEIKGKGEGRTDLEINLQICAYLGKEKQ